MQTALAIITKEGKVLIGKLKKEKVEEYGGIEHVFPSAQSEHDIKNKLIEEVKMQSDLDVIIVDKIGERTHPATNNLTEYYSCKPNSTQQLKVSPDADIEEFIWVEPQQIVDYMPSIFEKLKEYLQT